MKKKIILSLLEMLCGLVVSAIVCLGIDINFLTKAIVFLIFLIVAESIVLSIFDCSILCSVMRGIFKRIRLGACGKWLRVGEKVKFFHPDRIEIRDYCDVAQNVVFAPLCERGGG